MTKHHGGPVREIPVFCPTTHWLTRTIAGNHGPRQNFRIKNPFAHARRAVHGQPEQQISPRRARRSTHDPIWLSSER
jgi:hypothetical protein